MNKLVRGGVILSILSLFVVFIYAQSQTENELNIANGSQIQFNTIGNILETDLTLDSAKADSILVDEVNIQDPVKAGKDEQKKEGQDRSEAKKLVEKTVMSKSAGANRGSFVATAYCLRGKTAMGHSVRHGIIAADPRVLRLGSKIYVNGGGYSGSYLVSDTGGKIKGKRLDIWMASCTEARRFGRRTVTVHVP